MANFNTLFVLVQITDHGWLSLSSWWCRDCIRGRSDRLLQPFISQNAHQFRLSPGRRLSVSSLLMRSPTLSEETPDAAAPSPKTIFLMAVYGGLSLSSPPFFMQLFFPDISRFFKIPDGAAGNCASTLAR